jgi:outer membrane protein assembly factor BamB
MKLFKNTQTHLITLPTNFPAGIAVKTSKACYWVKDGKLFKLISDRAEKSWSFTTVNAEESALSGMKIAGKLGFRDGTLIKNIADGKIYLISQNKRRHIVSPDTFIMYGLNRDMVIEVSELETNMHDQGDNL